MKLEIDTINKTIKVEEQVNFCELNKELKKMLGDNLKEYTVLPHANIITTYPIYTGPQWFVVTNPCAPTYLAYQPFTINCGITGTSAVNTLT